LAASGNGDAGTFLLKTFRRGQSDTAISAGNYGDFSIETAHEFLL
jgi:hypothetical protein